jgi:hypothetical protein
VRVLRKRVSHPQSGAHNRPQDQDEKAKLGKALSRVIALLLETDLSTVSVSNACHSVAAGCTILIAGWWRGLGHVWTCARSILLSGPLPHFNEKQFARCRQLVTMGLEALEDAASSGLHAGTKSPDVLAAGRVELSDGFILRLRCSKFNRLLRRSRTAALRKSCRHTKKRCHESEWGGGKLFLGYNSLSGTTRVLELGHSPFRTLGIRSDTTTHETNQPQISHRRHSA